MARIGKLNREMIVREAIVLLNEGGLDAVSLRNIAARLGVRAPSLARHVGDKAQLLVLVSSAIFAEALASIPQGLSGAGWLEGFGHALRRKQRDTRDIAALLSVVTPDAAAEQDASTRLHDLMREAGLQGARAQTQQTAIQALVTGWMIFEKSPRSEQFAARLNSDHAFDDSLKALIAGFDNGR